MKLKRYIKRIDLRDPIPLAPTADHLGELFPEDRVMISIEWEYPSQFSRPRRALGPLYIQVASLLFERVYTYDASGAHEVSFPPCAVDRALQCGLSMTAFLFVAGIPVIEDGVCGRHVHITRTFDIYAVPFEYLVYSYRLSSIFTAHAVSYEDGKFIAKFRQSVSRYARVTDEYDSHHNFISLSPRYYTVEFRWNENVPALALPVLAELYKRRFEVHCEGCDGVYTIRVPRRTVEHFVESINDPDLRNLLREYIDAIAEKRHITIGGSFLRSLPTFSSLLSSELMRLYELYDAWSGVKIVADRDMYYASCVDCCPNDQCRLEVDTTFGEYVSQL